VVKEECYEVGVDKEVDEVESATALPSEEVRAKSNDYSCIIQILPFFA